MHQCNQYTAPTTWADQLSCDCDTLSGLQQRKHQRARIIATPRAVYAPVFALHCAASHGPAQHTPHAADVGEVAAADWNAAPVHHLATQRSGAKRVTAAERAHSCAWNGMIQRVRQSRPAAPLPSRPRTSPPAQPLWLKSPVRRLRYVFPSSAAAASARVAGALRRFPSRDPPHGADARKEGRSTDPAQTVRCCLQLD